MSKNSKQKFSVSIKILGQEFTANGDTILNALNKLKFKLIKIKGAGVLRVSTETSKTDIRLTKFKIERLIANQWEIDLLAKRLEIAL